VDAYTVVINACSSVCFCVFQNEPEMQTAQTWKAASASILKAETVAGQAGDFACVFKEGWHGAANHIPTLGRPRCRAAQRKHPNLLLGGAIAGLRRWQLYTRVQRCRFDALYSRSRRKISRTESEEPKVASSRERKAGDL
jgi:hypothetical protein